MASNTLRFLSTFFAPVLLLNLYKGNYGAGILAGVCLFLCVVFGFFNEASISFTKNKALPFIGRHSIEVWKYIKAKPKLSLSVSLMLIAIYKFFGAFTSRSFGNDFHFGLFFLFSSIVIFIIHKNKLKDVVMKIIGYGWKKVSICFSVLLVVFCYIHSYYWMLAFSVFYFTAMIAVIKGKTKEFFGTLFLGRHGWGIPFAVVITLLSVMTIEAFLKNKDSLYNLGATMVFAIFLGMFFIGGNIVSGKLPKFFKK